VHIKVSLSRECPAGLTRRLGRSIRGRLKARPRTRKETSSIVLNAPHALATGRFENGNPGKLAARPTHSFATQDGSHALWVGVDPNPELTALHSAIARTLTAAIDYKPEDRPYRPHITLARLGSLAADTAVQFVTKNVAFHFAPFPVTEFALYASSFAGDVPRYQIRARYGPSQPAS
jgi:2'-5' RNA ligase